MTTQNHTKNYYSCLDCKRCTVKLKEYYMVQNSLWDSVVSRKPKIVRLISNNKSKLITVTNYGFLCIGCLEKRIGRKLNKHDFTSVPINDLVSYPEKSKRLVNRLTSE